MVPSFVLMLVHLLHETHHIGFFMPLHSRGCMYTRSSNSSFFVNKEIHILWTLIYQQRYVRKTQIEGAIIEDLVYYTSTLKFLHQNLFYIAWWQKDYYTITFLLLHYTLALNCTSFHNADAFLSSFFSVKSDTKVDICVHSLLY